VPRSPGFCDIVNPWHGQTQVKLAAIYTFPWAIQTSMALQSYPGQPQLGSYVYSNAQIAPSLGRNLASCGTSATCTGTSTITFEPNYSEFEDRYNQFDIRFAKDVKVYKTHVQGIVDLFNAFNARPVLALTTRYSGTTGGSFLSPTSTLVGRLIKFSAQINF
jgi:hypothetical protein